MSLAQIVAEADKDAPFWKKSDNVSGKEQEALAELRSAFNL